MGWVLQSVLVGGESVGVLLNREISSAQRRTECAPDSGRGEGDGPVPSAAPRCPWVFSRAPQQQTGLLGWWAVARHRAPIYPPMAGHGSLSAVPAADLRRLRADPLDRADDHAGPARRLLGADRLLPGRSLVQGGAVRPAIRRALRPLPAKRTLLAATAAAASRARSLTMFWREPRPFPLRVSFCVPPAHAAPDAFDEHSHPRRYPRGVRAQSV